MNLERIGKFFGEKAIKPKIERLREKVENFDVEIFDGENLEGLKGRAYLITANHVKPEGAASQQSGLSQDAFVIERTIANRTGQQVRIVSKCDDGWWADNVYKYFQKYVYQPFGKGMIEGAGLIPIKKNPGSFNRDFMKTVELVAEKGEPILIFPEGTWYDDYDKEHPMSNGAAQIAMKYGLPVVPTYIKGSNSWKPEGKIQLAFGESIDVTGKTKEEITELIRQGIAKEQETVNSAIEEEQQEN